jgi:hypothetical protein
LIIKDKRLELLRLKNSAEDDQMLLESSSLNEKFSHEIEVSEDRLKKLEMQLERL